MDARLSETMQLAPRIEAALDQHFPGGTVAGADHLVDCMRYATFSGGRRMRPMLCLLGAGACGIGADAVLPVACAVEYLHTASLIYDDLPAMDNADRRRGMQPVHVRYGEGVALLAGLSLVAHALRMLAPWPRLSALAAQCVGHEGMSAGQAIDLRGGRRDGNHYLKTTALFRLAVTAGAIAHGGDEAAIQALDRFGGRLGAAYQLMDDADDEFAQGLREQAQTELALAGAALAPLGDRARTLAAYGKSLLTPVGLSQSPSSTQ
jgi:geranylgeranyl diphosphate synthase type II